MEADFEDTVLAPARPHPQQDSGIDEDTLVPRRREEHGVSAPASGPVVARVDTPVRVPEPRPEQTAQDGAVSAMQAQSARSSKTATKRHVSTKQGERHPPSLVEPAPTRQRRVPLTHKRLQETLRLPEAAHEPSVLSAAHPTAPPAALAVPVFGFRIGERPPISLDVPALVGRHPAAPRIPGKVFPRLVRVPSALSEVSGTHLELRQDGASVIVTDLRSTNGTVVRMPGSRPIKLRQGESLVVRPGTLVDIGDGNVIEILSPPRLGVPADSVGDGRWS